MNATGRFLPRITKPLVLVAFLAAVALGLQAIDPGSTRAVDTLIVNNVGDGVDIAIGDGTCETVTSGQCTLRAAILEANGESDKVDIIGGDVDVDESSTITAVDDIDDVLLPLLAGGLDQVDIIDGGVDVDESGVVDAADDLADVLLALDAGGTNQVDIIDGEIDVNESGAVDGTDDLANVLLGRIDGDTDHDIIKFLASLFTQNSPATIKLTSQLPTVFEDLTIDAIDRGVIIDGNGATDGLHVRTDDFTILGGGATLEITDFSGDGIDIAPASSGGDLDDIEIDGVDINDVGDRGIEIEDFANLGSSTVKITNSEITAPSGDGIFILQDGSPLEDNKVLISGNTINADSEAVIIDFDGDMSVGDVLDIDVVDNVQLVSTGDDAVEIEYCDTFGCDIIDAEIDVDVSRNGSIDAWDSAVEVDIDGGSGPNVSDDATVEVDIDNNGPMNGTTAAALDVDIDVCCATSGSTSTVNIDFNKDITSTTAILVNNDVCCGDSNTSVVNASDNRDLIGTSSDGVTITSNALDTSGVVDASGNTATIHVDRNRDISGDSDAVDLLAQAGSDDSPDPGDSDNNDATITVDDNRNITGDASGAGEAIEAEAAAGGDLAAPDGSLTGSNGNTVTLSASRNNDISGDEEGVDFGANVCCDDSNTIDIMINDNTGDILGGLAGGDHHAIAIGRSGTPAISTIYLCCSQNTVEIKDNLGIIAGTDDAIEFSVCGELATAVFDTDCIDDSETIATISGNVIVESLLLGDSGAGIELCCGDFGDGAGEKGVTRSVIRDNTITGTDDGGVIINNVSGVQIGPDNVITDNGGPSGVDVIEDDLTGTGLPEADGNTITRNEIYDNTGLGIDLQANGVDGCPGVDAGDDPNNCLKRPTISLLTGTVINGVGCAGCEVELFVADALPADQDPGDDPQSGEGAEFLLSTTADGLGSWSVKLCETPAGKITATQTNDNGDTSEFSENFVVPAIPQACATPTSTPTATNTSGPTNTPVDTPTFTPTPTITLTPTVTSTATVTATATATVTDTPVGPTATSTSTTAPPTATSAPVTPTATNTPPTVTPKPPLGDVSGDMVVNAIDALLVNQLIAALVSSLPFENNADVNLDGEIDARDSALILQFGAGLIPTLPPPSSSGGNGLLGW